MITVGSIGLKATGVYNNKFMLAVFCIAIVAVTREPCVIGNDRIARFRQPIEQCGFTHIGSSDQSDNRFHQ